MSYNYIDRAIAIASKNQRTERLMTINALNIIRIDDDLFDLDRLDINLASTTELINSIPTWAHTRTSEDAADLLDDIATIFKYLAANQLDDVYNGTDPDAAPEISDRLDDAISELHIALGNLDNMIDLSIFLRN